MSRHAYDAQRNTTNTLYPNPMMPFTLCITGGIGSGKSNLLLHLMLNKNHYRSAFHQVLLLSPTLLLDQKIKQLMFCEDLCASNQVLEDAQWRKRCNEALAADQELPERTILPAMHPIDTDDLYDHYVPSIIQNIMADQLEVITKFGKDAADRCLIVFEDSPSLGCFSGRRTQQDLLSKMVLTCRHYKISCIFLTQQFKVVSKGIRLNLTSGMFFQTSDNKAKEVHETFDASFSKAKWIEYYSILTNKEFSFMQINLHNHKGSCLIADLDKIAA